MKTWIVKVDENNISKKDMAQLGEIVANGGLVAFPTETVYGLGANAFDSDAVGRIFEAKGRPSDNPLIVHLADIKDLSKVVREIPKSAKLLFERFSPGPLTVILKKSDKLCDAVTAGLDTVAVRIPSDKIARELISSSGVPIAAPSANISGKPSPTTARHVIADMNGRIDAIIDSKDCDVGVESTIIDLSGEVGVILRPGGVTYSQIKEVISDVIVDANITEEIKDGQKPKCPGMKYKHYAPEAEVVVVEGELGAVREKIEQLLVENKDKKTGVLAYEGAKYSMGHVTSSGADNRTFAKNLFRQLREFDEYGADIVFAEFVFDEEYGMAVKNRLYKAAGYKVIHV